MSLPLPSPPPSRFALGLTHADVEEFQTILREECGEAVELPEAWARATSVLALFEYLLGYASGHRGLELPAGS